MANENKTAKEYVQKGYLIAHLANCGIRTINYDEWERLCERIHEAKPADVVEVKHGRWIKDRLCSTSGGTYGVRRCSVCEHYFQDLVNEYNYCPNCGADMRGENNELYK